MKFKTQGESPLPDVVDLRGHTVIGLDPSMSSYGWAVLHDSAVEYGTVEFAPGPARLLHVEQFLTQLLQQIGTDQLIAAGVEGYAHDARHAAHTAGEVGGVTRLTLSRFGVAFIEPSPNAVKKFATGKGNCDKSLILKEMFRRYGLDCTKDGEADAAAIAFMTAARQGLVTGLTKAQQEAVDDVGGEKKRPKKATKR